MMGARRGVFGGIVSALVATAGSLAAQQKPAAVQPARLEVSLAEAVRRALDVQPDMVQARGNVRNAGADGRSAWGAWLPTVTTSASASRSNQATFAPGDTVRLPPVYSYSGGLIASLDLFDGFRRVANLRATSADQDAAGVGLVGQRYQTTSATQQLFYTALANEELVRVAEAQLERAKEQLQISVNKFQAGAATRSDTLTATVDLGNGHLALLQANANLATAQANLGRQIGVDQPVGAVPDTAFPGLPDTAALRASALETAPIVDQAEAQARAAGARRWTARSQYWPSLSVSYNNSRTGTGSPDLPLFGNLRETFSWRFGLSWTLFNGFQREQSQVSASVTRDVASARAADARRQVNAQLTQQLAALFTAYAQIGITGANVAAATEARRVTQERYRLGAGTLLDLLTAEANLTQAEVNRVQARYNYLSARAQVEALVGHPL
jgi:outer membrane protein TolC